MTQTKEQVMKALEFRKLFSSLDEDGQEKVLNVLQALEFAQSVMCVSENSGH